MESVWPPMKRHAGDGYILECILNATRIANLYSESPVVTESDVLDMVQGSFPDCVVMHMSDSYFLSFTGAHIFNLPSKFGVFDKEMIGELFFFYMINSSKHLYQLPLNEFCLSVRIWIIAKTKTSKYIVKHNNEEVSYLDELILFHYRNWTSSEPLIVTTETTVKYQILHPIHECPAQCKDFPIHYTVKDVLRDVKYCHTLVSDYTCDISFEKNVTEITEPIVFRFQLKSPLERKSQLQNSVTPASTYSKLGYRPLKNMLESEQKLLDNGIKLCYHRGVSAMASNDVSIYYPGFQTFADNCKSITISAEDCKFARILCLEMAEVYLNEARRVNQVYEVFRAYLHPSCVINDQQNAPLPDLRIANALLAVIKNEDGATDNEPLREVISYYCQISSNNNYSCPFFLIVLTGANMTIYGAVCVGHVYVDRLIPPVWLVPQIKNSDAMINTARVLKALKEAVCERMNYNVSLSQPEYPYFQGFEYDSAWIEIQYSKEVQPHVFSGSLSGGALSEMKVIIKFAETYSVDVHNLLAKSKHAPTLLYFSYIGRFIAVVMEEVEGLDVQKYLAKNPCSFESIKSQCQAILATLTKNQYVHGDLRHPNILIERNTSVKIIDFDWAGVQGEARYPYYLNQDECAWPDGASDGELICYAHDLYWINKLDELKS